MTSLMIRRHRLASLLRTLIKSVVPYMMSAGHNKLSSVDNPKHWQERVKTSNCMIDCIGIPILKTEKSLWLLSLNQLLGIYLILHEYDYIRGTWFSSPTPARCLWCLFWLGHHGTVKKTRTWRKLMKASVFINWEGTARIADEDGNGETVWQISNSNAVST